MKWLSCLLIFLTTVNEMFAMNSAPYGSWKSEISSEMLSSGELRFSDIFLIDNTLYWLESRPADGGRTTIMSYTQKGGEKELLPKKYNVRTRVHEYGGGAFLPTSNIIFFVNDHDQQVYSLSPGGQIMQITSQKNARFADGSMAPSGKELYYVMEEHGDQVVNSIVKIDIGTGEIQKVASGNDFYSNPRVSPNGKTLAFITWNNPNLPWDGSQLWELDLKTKTKYQLAGSSSISIMDAMWSPKNKLFFVSDVNGWWNIYAEKGESCLDETNREFALPGWLFNRPMYGFSSSGVIASYVHNGTSGLVEIRPEKPSTPIDLPYTCIKSLSVSKNQIAMIASSPTEPSTILIYDLKSKKSHVIKRATKLSLKEEWISKPQEIVFNTSDNAKAYAFYYPPKNPNYTGPKGELPPLLVQAHGGPTSMVYPCLSLGIQYWTSRGFAFVDVNYRGSTGYGRAYRNSLRSKWGVYDVDDSINAANYLVDKKLVDPNRLAIEGGSAGGFTVLAVLAATDQFQVGADFFGVSDLELLTKDTHKFEARYLDLLVGPFPQDKELYDARSPLNNIEKITKPVIIFQGDEDRIVPQEQSELVYESLKKRGIPTAYLLFKGEQHGFRKAENIKRAFEAELYFFSKILKFPLSDEIEPVHIDNLSSENNP